MQALVLATLGPSLLIALHLELGEESSGNCGPYIATAPTELPRAALSIMQLDRPYH